MYGQLYWSKGKPQWLQVLQSLVWNNYFPRFGDRINPTDPLNYYVTFKPEGGVLCICFTDELSYQAVEKVLTRQGGEILGARGLAGSNYKLRIKITDDSGQLSPLFYYLNTLNYRTAQPLREEVAVEFNVLAQQKLNEWYQYFLAQIGNVADGVKPLLHILLETLEAALNRQKTATTWDLLRRTAWLSYDVRNFMPLKAQYEAALCSCDAAATDAFAVAAGMSRGEYHARVSLINAPIARRLTPGGEFVWPYVLRNITSHQLGGHDFVRLTSEIVMDRDGVEREVLCFRFKNEIWYDTFVAVLQNYGAEPGAFCGREVGDDEHSYVLRIKTTDNVGSRLSLFLRSLNSMVYSSEPLELEIADTFIARTKEKLATWIQELEAEIRSSASGAGGLVQLVADLAAEQTQIRNYKERDGYLGLGWWDQLAYHPLPHMATWVSKDMDRLIQKIADYQISREATTAAAPAAGMRSR